MDPLLLVALIGKGALEVMTLVQKLQEQHANGTSITTEQAEELRQKAKDSQKAAEDAWANS
jgi:hypothetical protein